jgi:hypothetical protein
MEIGDWVVIESITGLGTSGSPFVLSLSVVNNTYENATTTIDGIVRLSNITTISSSTTGNAVITQGILGGLIGTTNTKLAAGSHTHAAGDVTSGTFADARIPDLNASKITAGTFGVVRGGTGAATLASGEVLIGAGTGAVTTLSRSGIDSRTAFPTTYANITGTVPTWNQNTTGNAATATSASNIDGIAFRNGNSTNPSNPDSINENGISYINSVSLFGQVDGALYSQAYSTSWVHQIFGDYRTGQLAVRGRNNGTLTAWRTIRDSVNFVAGTTASTYAAGNDARLSDARTPLAHTHAIANVTGLQDALNLKANLASPALTGTPNAPTAAAGTNTTQVATTAFVQTAVSGLIDSAPGTLDTLNELAAALGDDPNFATTVSTSIGTKVTANTAITAGTATKITYDTKGLVTSGTTLAAADIPNLDAGKITSGTFGVVRGGTGVTTLASGEVLIGAGTGVITTLSRVGIDTRFSFPPEPHTLDSHSDVTISSPSNGQVLKYSGTGWINAADSVGANGDVVGPSSSSNEDIVVFDGTTGKIIKASGLTLTDITAQISGKADTVHTHAASAITSGTLSVERGGTGAATHTSGNVLIGAGTGAVTTLSRSGIDSRTSFPPTAHTHAIADVTGLQTALDGKAASSHTHGNITNAGAIGSTADLVAVTTTSGVLTTASRSGIDSRASFPPSAHTHGNISNTGTISSTATIASGDRLIIGDAGTITQSSITFGTSTTTFLRNDGTWQTGTGAVQSVDGLTGAVVTEALTTSNSTVNSVTYGRTLGQAIIDSVGTRMRISTGFFAPTGSSTSSSISFGTTFAAVPMVVVFSLKASGTTTTAVVAKATAVSTTGATVTCSFVTPSTSGYTPAAETYGWIAIGY